MPKQKVEYEQTHRIELASSQVNADGEFEILAITAGEAKAGSSQPIPSKQSLSLWDGAQTFIDHHWFGHSVHDVAGVCHAPTWDEKAQGIKLTLRPVGPSAPVLHGARPADARRWRKTKDRFFCRYGFHGQRKRS